MQVFHGSVLCTWRELSGMLRSDKIGNDDSDIVHACPCHVGYGQFTVWWDRQAMITDKYLQCSKKYMLSFWTNGKKLNICF